MAVKKQYLIRTMWGIGFVLLVVIIFGAKKHPDENTLLAQNAQSEMKIVAGIVHRLYLRDDEFFDDHRNSDEYWRITTELIDKSDELGAFAYSVRKARIEQWKSIGFVLDQWGFPYEANVSFAGSKLNVAIKCAGADKTYNTEDDLYLKQSFEHHREHD